MLKTQSFTRNLYVANQYAAKPQSLENKVILITGAGDGIGRAVALTYAKLGATCILLGRTVSKLENTYDAIVDAGYPEPAIVPLDLKGASAQHYKDMGNTIIDQFGHLDGLVLNASILGMLCPFSQIKQDEWQDIMQVNVNASFMLIQGVLPALEKSPGSASVITTTSTVGREGRKFWGTYSVSKFATEGMTEVLAAEYDAQNIRFNCVNPGGTRTAMRASAFPAEDKAQLRTPEDIMPTYCYLMSDDSIEHTGHLFECQPK
ncbi:YciK family oxidoreductase [Alteromonas sp. ASW11-36]|uniref:YciK family oxidoreductase n=1 Tax=Alteromonas arenosi TaxID=3055817 RepID=A0ABT7SWZ2_9ALTE|nr:YciK family oxidoreductase [Alteromonas sp. ASW11-36]MDM7860712.1 YciK family oxidoreductase [Alteromonas sp. ASW11-36]